MLVLNVLLLLLKWILVEPPETPPSVSVCFFRGLFECSVGMSIGLLGFIRRSRRQKQATIVLAK